MNATRWTILGVVAALAILTAPAALDAAGFDGSVVDLTGSARAGDCDAEVDTTVTALGISKRIYTCIKIEG